MIGKLTVVKGDATEPIGEGIKIIPHVCNDRHRFGAGFVLALKRKWPEVETVYREMFENEKGELGEISIKQVEDNIYVVNMIAQHGTGEYEGKPIRYGSLAFCMEKVAMLTKKFSKASIHCPKFGCGLSKGDFGFVKQLIIEIWINEGIDVTIYEFNG